MVEKAKKKNKAASALAKLRWSKIAPEDRGKLMPHTGKPRIYPKCPRYKNQSHRFTDNRCPCGYVRKLLKTKAIKI